MMRLDFDTLDVTPEERRLLEDVRRFADGDVMAAAPMFDRDRTYPEPLVARMRELGLFGLTNPIAPLPPGNRVLMSAAVQMELGRAWIALCGILNPHLQVTWLIDRFGTEEQRALLKPLATGDMRAALAITEPGAGSDVQAIATVAAPVSGGYALTGRKIWVANGLRADLILVLAKTDPEARPAHRGMSAMLVRKPAGETEGEGFAIGDAIPTLGYRAAEAVPITFDGFRLAQDDILGGEAGMGQGMRQMMTAMEVGRIGVAARATGLAQTALDLALRHATARRAFGLPIAEHQAVQLKLADIATRTEAARLLVMQAVAEKQAGRRTDLAAGMAKLFASETAIAASQEAMRIHGGAGYSEELSVERLYRDAIVLALGEGSNEIQQTLIARRLVELRGAE